MPAPEFRPGFRLSLLDTLILGLGSYGSIWFWPKAEWLGFIIAFVVGHFFLFCNVFRISRRLELVWAGIFVVLAVGTVKSSDDSWKAMTVLSLIVTMLVIALEMRKPSYHGIGWSRINPQLRQWWEAHHR